MFFDIFVNQWLVTSFAGGKRFHIDYKNVTSFLCCIIASLKDTNSRKWRMQTQSS